MSLFDGKDCLVLYDNGRRGKYHAQQEVAAMTAFHLNWQQAHIGSGVQVAVLWDDDKYYEATVVQEQNKKRPLYLEYDDGDEEWVDL